MIHFRTRKTADQLKEIFKNRDIEEELEYMAKHIKNGYFRPDETEFIRWMCYAALDAIRREK